MYQELVKYPDCTKWESILLVIGIVTGVFVASSFTWFLKEWGVPLVDFLAFGALVAFAVWVFRKRILEYRYSLMDTELLVARKVGRKETSVLSLEVTDIVSIGAVDKECKLPTQRHTVRSRRLKTVQIIYSVDSGPKRVILQPSEHLLSLIRTRAACKEPRTSAE